LDPDPLVRGAYTQHWFLLSRVRFTFAGEEQTAEDAEDGPPELLFIHGGHTAKISGQNKEAIFQKAVSEKKSETIF
jgi:hypothetical protein